MVMVVWSVRSAVAEALPGWTCAIAPDLSGAPRVAIIELVDA